jgi:hypothetical protein
MRCALRSTQNEVIALLEAHTEVCTTGNLAHVRLQTKAATSVCCSCDRDVFCSDVLFCEYFQNMSADLDAHPTCSCAWLVISKPAIVLCIPPVFRI